jgi:hypothetical protein
MLMKKTGSNAISSTERWLNRRTLALVVPARYLSPISRSHASIGRSGPAVKRFSSTLPMRKLFAVRAYRSQPVASVWLAANSQAVSA